MPYWPLSVGPTWNKNWGPLTVFVAQQKKYSRKAVLQNVTLLNYNHGGIKSNQPILVSVNLPMFAESLPSSTNPYKTQLTLFFSFRTALLIT